MRKVMVMFGLCALFFGIKAVGQTLTPKDTSMVTNKGRLKKFLPRHRAKWLTTDMGFQFTLGLALYEMAVREMRTQGNVSFSGNVCAQ